MADYPPRLTFNASEPNALEVVRQVFWNRLRIDFNWRDIRGEDTTFRYYVDFARERDEDDFKRLVVDVFWEFVRQGVVSPGTTTGDPRPPFFHITQYGKRVLQDPLFQPNDPVAYLTQLGKSVANPDATVLAYLREALNCFDRHTLVASAMMLGIASERVFELVCDSLLAALNSANEKATFQGILDRFPMKPKLDWVMAKFQQVQTPRRPTGFPDDTDIVVLGIYNLIRNQRNDLGHPQPTPPAVNQDMAYGYLRLFPSYYATAEAVRDFLAKNRV